MPTVDLKPQAGTVAALVRSREATLPLQPEPARQWKLPRLAAFRFLALACTGWPATRRTVVWSATLILSTAISADPSAAQAREDFLTADIDSTVSPRDDFFQYANGTWFKRHPVPDDAGSWGIWNEAAERMAFQLRRISEEAAAKQAQRGSSEQLIGDFWFTGMDSTALNRQGLAPLKPDLDRIDRIRSVRDLIDVVATFHVREQAIGNPWYRVLFFGHVEQDDKNTNRWIYSLLQSGITLAPAAYDSAADPRAARLQRAFREYLCRTFLRLQGDSGTARASADAVFELEARLARSFDRRHGYQMLGLAELSRLAPTIEWERYFRHIGLTGADSVNVRNPRFYQALDSLLRATPLETWKNYLRFSLIKVNAALLDDETLGDYFAFDRVSTGALRPRPRWRRVLDREANFGLGQPLARLYVEQHVPASVIARHQAVGEAVRAAFRERIGHLDWMSDSTKNSALLKLARLKITIGFSGDWMDFSTMPLRRDSYALNVMRAGKWFHDLDMKKLGHPVDKGASDPRPSLNEASYVDTNNEVIVLPGPTVSVPGWRDEELDDAVVYGATPLGHEISHAFDSDGRHYDADGNRADWWTAADDSAFRERAQVMVDEYNEFMPLDGLHVDGRRSLRENMADLVGLRITLDAFKKTEQFKKHELIGGFTPLQRFFLAYAYSRMGHDREATLAAKLRNGAYAPFRERVNGVLMNIPEFYEAFGVKPGDRMYRREEARVKIW